MTDREPYRAPGPEYAYYEPGMWLTEPPRPRWFWLRWERIPGFGFGIGVKPSEGGWLASVTFARWHCGFGRRGPPKILGRVERTVTQTWIDVDP